MRQYKKFEEDWRWIELVWSENSLPIIYNIKKKAQKNLFSMDMVRIRREQIDEAIY